MPCRHRNKTNWREYCVWCNNYTRVGTGCLLDIPLPHELPQAIAPFAPRNRQHYYNDPTALEAKRGKINRFRLTKEERARMDAT